MGTYCVSCKKHTVKEKSNVRKTKQNRLKLLSNCAVWGKKISTFIKNQELNIFNYISNDSFKMKKMSNKFSLTRD